MLLFLFANLHIYKLKKKKSISKDVTAFLEYSMQIIWKTQEVGNYNPKEWSFWISINTLHSYPDRFQASVERPILYDFDK